MKKIIVASFQCESNSKAKLHPKKSDFEYFTGEDIFKKLVVKEIFEKNGFEAVPSVYAVALSMLWLYCCLSILVYGGALNRLLAERKNVTGM